MLLLPGPNHLQNLTPKFKILNVFWTCSVSKRKTKQFYVFNCLSNLKNSVTSIDSKNVPNVMQVALK